MSTNCIKCVKNERTGNDLLCDECRDLELARMHDNPSLYVHRTDAYGNPCTYTKEEAARLDDVERQMDEYEDVHAEADRVSAAFARGRRRIDDDLASHGIKIEHDEVGPAVWVDDILVFRPDLQMDKARGYDAFVALHEKLATQVAVAFVEYKAARKSDEEIYTMASAAVDRCEKCPRTADGVIALPGMTIYPAHPIEPDDSMVLVLGGLCDGEWLRDGDELDISKCYSTPERAAAARKPEGGE